MSTNDLAVIKQIVDLIGHLAWPVATIILLCLVRRPISLVSTALVERIRDPQSTLRASYGEAKIGIFGSGPPNRKVELFNKLKSDPELEKRLIEWLTKENLNLTPTELVFYESNEELLKKVIKEVSW